MLGWRKLEVWKKAHQLVLDIYTATKTFPTEERFRLTDQLCRSVISTPANIVEGQSRQTTKEYLQFLYNARGSLEETRYYLILAKDLKYLSDEECKCLEESCEVISKMLNSLILSLKERQKVAQLS